MRRVLVAICAAMLAAMLGAPASADRRVALDPDDSPGKLDIVAVVAKEIVKNGQVRLVYRIVTYEPWDTSLLPLGSNESDKHIYLLFRFDGNFAVIVGRNESGKLVAEMFNGRHGSVRVRRPDAHSVLISFPRNFIKTDAYRWRGITAFEDGSSACPTTGTVADQTDPSSCPDRTRWFAHRL